MITTALIYRDTLAALTESARLNNTTTKSLMEALLRQSLGLERIAGRERIYGKNDRPSIKRRRKSKPTHILIAAGQEYDLWDFEAYYRGLLKERRDVLKFIPTRNDILLADCLLIDGEVKVNMGIFGKVASRRKHEYKIVFELAENQWIDVKLLNSEWPYLSFELAERRKNCATIATKQQFVA